MNSIQEHEKQDRRVRRTRRALRKALSDLMEEKGYDQVTIEELTERADIGRTTFYLHYSAKQDLLLEQFGEMIDQLVAQLSQTPLSAWGQEGDIRSVDDYPNRPICMIFQHAADNKDLYQIVLRGEGVDQASERLQVIMTNAVNTFLSHKLGQQDEQIALKIPIDLFGNYFAGAILGVIKWWLEADMPYSSEKMEEIFFQLFLPGAIQTLGTELE